MPSRSSWTRPQPTSGSRLTRRTTEVTLESAAARSRLSTSTRSGAGRFSRKFGSSAGFCSGMSSCRFRYRNPSLPDDQDALSPPPAPRSMRASAPTAAAPMATAATPATRIQAVRFFIPSASTAGIEELGPLLGLGRVDAGRELLAQPAVALPRFLGLVLLLESGREPHQGMIARNRRLGVVHDLTIPRHRLVELAVLAVGLREGEPGQVRHEGVAVAPGGQLFELL